MDNFCLTHNWRSGLTLKVCKYNSAHHLIKGEKSYEYSFFIKMVSKLETKDNFFPGKKCLTKIYRNIIISGKILKAFSLKSGIRQEWLPAPLLFDMVLEVQANTVRQGKKEKS